MPRVKSTVAGTQGRLGRGRWTHHRAAGKSKGCWLASSRASGGASLTLPPPGKLRAPTLVLLHLAFVWVLDSGLQAYTLTAFQHWAISQDHTQLLHEGSGTELRSASTLLMEPSPKVPENSIMQPSSGLGCFVLYFVCFCFCFRIHATFIYVYCKPNNLLMYSKVYHLYFNKSL